MISFGAEIALFQNFHCKLFPGVFMKKITFMAILAIAAASFGFADDGWSVHGLIRTGFEGNFDAKDAETRVYKDGKYYGNAKSRLRLNVGYDQSTCGFRMRFQCDGFGYLSESVSVTGGLKDTWFTGDNLKYAMGYAKFLDGKIIAEAGKLQDFYTGSEGREEFNICYYGSQTGYGARAVFNPFEELFLAAGASTYRAEKYVATDDEVVENKAKAGDYKLNEKTLGFSGKYKNENFTIAGGYNLAGEGFGYLGITGVPNLKLYAEGRYLGKDISGKTDADGEKTEDITVSEVLSYNFKDSCPLELGVLFYQRIVKDDAAYEFYPFASCAINDVVNAELEFGLIKYSEPSKHKNRDGDDTDMTYDVTPSLKFKAGKDATVKVYFNYDKNDKSAVGTTMRVNF